MKIKIKSVLASADGVLAPGDTVEVDDATADMLIRKGIAEPVKAAPKKKAKVDAEVVDAEPVERAVVDGPEETR
jgi:hypothetical protein